MKGGKQPGAGRPVGSYTRPQIRDYFTEKDIADLVASAKSKAKEGNDTMLRTLLEQIFGKPAQALELAGKDGEAIVVKIVQYGAGTPTENGSTIAPQVPA